MSKEQANQPEHGPQCPMCGAFQCEHSKKYSKDFLKLLQEKGVARLLKGSSFEGSFEEWEHHRKFIADVMKDGSILDVGCGNGFFVRCLQEWSGKQLDPYGVEIDENFIQQTTEVFPDKPGHFLLAEEKSSADFPQAFNTVFWCVWDGFSLENEGGKQFLKRIQSRILPGGRLILGFYNPTREEIELKLECLRKQFPKLEVRYAEGEGVSETLAFVDL